MKLPGLGDIPMVGQLFRTRLIHHDHTEIVVSLRVRKVDNQSEEMENGEEKDNGGGEKKDGGKGDEVKRAAPKTQKKVGLK